MSLPPAHKAVSETPAKMDVTEPQNTETAEKDIEKSVRTYFVIYDLLAPFSPLDPDPYSPSLPFS